MGQLAAGAHMTYGTRLLLGLAVFTAGCEGRVVATGSALLRLDPEPAGAVCPAGGTAIHTGQDTDGDGLLSDAEILESEYVCGAAPVATLIRVEPEPPGPNCPAGGTAIHTGVDDDGDGALANGEIDQSAFVCDDDDGTLVGSFTIRNAADAVFLADYRRLTGGLQIETQDVTSFDLPLLTRLGGGLSVRYNAALADLDGLAALGSIGGGILIESNAALRSLHGLAALSRIEGGLYVQNNAVLESLRGLEGIGAANDLSLFMNPLLTDLGGLDGLTYSGGLYVQDSPALQSFAGLEQLRAIGGLFNLQRLTALESLAGLEGLQSVGRDLFIYGNVQLPSLAGLGGLASIGGRLQVLDNDALLRLGLDGLTSLGGPLHVTDNGALPTCYVTALLDQLQAAGFTGEASTSGNDEAGVCP